MLQSKNCSCTCSETFNPMPYFFKHSIQSYAALPVAVANAAMLRSPTASKFVADAQFLPN